MNVARNRWLLIALGVVVVFYFGDLGYRKLYEEPAKTDARRTEQLNKRLRTAKLELAKAKNASRQLEGLEKRSLPWDPELARSRYQAWLLQLVKDAKLTGTSVDSSEPVSVSQSTRRGKRPIELYKRFTFTVRGRGDLTQVTHFLYEFYRAGHLQKIRSISMIPVGSSQEVNLTVAVEALALPQADREGELTSLVSDQLAQADVRDYQLIARRNFFGRGGAESAWKRIVLSAVTTNVQGVGEAWFAVGPNRETRILQVDQAMAMPTYELRVIRLDDTGADVDVDGQRYHMTIGHSLADAALPPTSAGGDESAK